MFGAIAVIVIAVLIVAGALLLTFGLTRAADDDYDRR